MSVHLLNEMSFLDGITQEDIDYVKEHAIDGDAKAQYHLALMFDTGRGVPLIPTEAERWYRAAAEQGHPNACYYLARMYEIETSGIPTNDEEALKWYKKAAELGHKQAKDKISN
jgi:TPR repeat protein